MEKVLDVLSQHRLKHGSANIKRRDLGDLLRKLDGTDFWAEERVQALLQSVSGTAGETVDFIEFVRALYIDASSKYEAVRADLVGIMDSPDWDDGSYAPLLIRLAWHSSGTYCAATGTGGSNRATMRFSPEADDPENAGLGTARALLEPLKAKYSWLSYADLWILAAYVALEHTGGPRIDFVGGRKDGTAEQAIAPGRLPEAERGVAKGCVTDAEGRIEDWQNVTQHVRSTFQRMGLNDQEAVALICGGHVYGRCHPETSGYAGAWVENPTFFSNEYAADMIGDKWILVTHDTKMPDGGEVPVEVRPAPGKRQYIDLSKYEGEEEEDGARAARAAPDATEWPPGVYCCLSQWVNCRELPDTSSPIISRFVQDQRLSLLAVKVFGTAIRGLCERGGWVSIIASGGKRLFERVGDFDLSALKGSYRVVGKGALVYDSPSGSNSHGHLKLGEEFHVGEVAIAQSGEQVGALLGRRAGASKIEWVLLHSPAVGQAAELVVEGYNQQPRKPIKGQSGHQMMLVSDMVLLWDPGFREHLQAYADDEELLKRDFAAAFKRLTELGCPWTAGTAAQGGGTVQVTSKGCPFAPAG